jgi:2-dehydropantoate 2-reductase
MGAGAVGSYYGALLARDGHDVTMVARGPHLDALRRRGTVIVREADGRRWEAPVRAAGRPGAPAPDLAIVTTKSHHTLSAARALAEALGDATTVVSLQNGVENVARLASVLGPERVLGGIAFVGLRVREPGVVDHEAEGWVRIGDPAGPSERARRVHEMLASSWDVALSADIVRDQWHKLLWNAGFNAICAVTGATAGEALATPRSAALVRAAMEEVVAIAAAHGVALTDADVDEMAAPNPDLRDYRPSTARDLEAGKPLERDALCGFLAREGARLGIPTPVNAVLDGLLALQEDRARRT